MKAFDFSFFNEFECFGILEHDLTILEKVCLCSFMSVCEAKILLSLFMSITKTNGRNFDKFYI